MDEYCTVYNAAELIGKKWTLLILLELHKGKDGSRRYSELKSRLPRITPKILSLRLKELEHEKLIQKKVDSKTIPVKCEYSLTKSGEGLIGVVKEIKKWSLKHHVKNRLCENTACKNCAI